MAVSIDSNVFLIDLSFFHLAQHLETDSKTEQSILKHEVIQKGVLYHFEVYLKHHSKATKLLVKFLLYPTNYYQEEFYKYHSLNKFHLYLMLKNLLLLQQIVDVHAELLNSKKITIQINQIKI